MFIKYTLLEAYSMRKIRFILDVFKSSKVYLVWIISILIYLINILIRCEKYEIFRHRIDVHQYIKYLLI
jgi:hypothetical protein